MQTAAGAESQASSRVNILQDKPTTARENGEDIDRTNQGEYTAGQTGRTYCRTERGGHSAGPTRGNILQDKQPRRICRTILLYLVTDIQSNGNTIESLFRPLTRFLLKNLHEVYRKKKSLHLVTQALKFGNNSFSF